MIQSALAPPGNIAAELDRFHVTRQKTLGALQQVTSEQAAWAPRAGVWSMAQIADHLLRSEELYREQFGRLIQMAADGKGNTLYVSIQEVDTSLAMVPREVMALFEVPFRMLNMFVPSVVRETMVRYRFIAALNPKVSEPRSGLTLEKLQEDLAESMAQTEQLFSQPMPANVERLTISHPIMGNNNIVEMLRIMIAHEERHRGQMSTLRADPGFPKTGSFSRKSSSIT